LIGPAVVLTLVDCRKAIPPFVTASGWQYSSPCRLLQMRLDQLMPSQALHLPMLEVDRIVGLDHLAIG
jgi:hypothetical protein